VNYTIGWGVTTPEPPYFTDVKDGDWNTILQYESEWKKSKGFV
jgi:branched-chain amino acid transport system substrate-binding protein